MTRMPAVALAVAVAVSASIALGDTALAHERRNVGPYQFVVGWLAEPAFQGQPNAASVRISDTRATPAKAVEGLEKALSIEIRSGGLGPFTGTVRAVFGQPGLYALDVVPTAAGAYSFRIAGRVEDLEVNETFESGPGRFDEVKAQTALQYPARAPVGEDLAARLDAIAADIALARILALAAIVLAIAVPAGMLLVRRRTGT